MLSKQARHIVMSEALDWLYKDNPNIRFNPVVGGSRKCSWEDHIKSIRNYCKSQAVIYDNTNHHGGTIYHKPNNCNSWDCPSCRKKKASVLRSRIKAGTRKQSWKLLTLTFDPNLISLNDSLLTCSTVWDSFQKRLKRAFPDVQWIKVLEFQGNGYPHYHVILNKYVNINWIRSSWSAVGGGRIVHITAIKSKRVANYVSNYLSSKNHKHHERDYQFYVYSLRRFAFSRSFALRPWKKTTVILSRGIDFDCSSAFMEDVLNTFYTGHVFYAVVSRSKIKYLNLITDKHKLIMC